MLVAVEVAAAEVVGVAVVDGAAVVVGPLVGAAVVGATVVVGWSAPDVPPVVVGCAIAGRPSVAMAANASSVISAMTTNIRRSGRVLLKGPASDKQ